MVKTVLLPAAEGFVPIPARMPMTMYVMMGEPVQIMMSVPLALIVVIVAPEVLVKRRVHLGIRPVILTMVFVKITDPMQATLFVIEAPIVSTVALTKGALYTSCGFPMK